MKKKSEYYIDPEDLYKEVQDSQLKNECTEKLGEYIMLLHKKVLGFPAFRNYDYDEKNDMMMYSIERFMKRGIYTADVNKNLFAYFTTGIYTNYQNYLKKYYKRKNKEREYIENMLQQQEIQTRYTKDVIRSLREW